MLEKAWGYPDRSWIWVFEAELKRHMGVATYTIYIYIEHKYTPLSLEYFSLCERGKI